MGRFVRLLVLACMSSACTALSGVDALAVDDGALPNSGESGPNGGSTTSDASGSGASSSSSSPAGGEDDAGAGPPPGTVIINEPFATSADCARMTVTANAVATYEPNGRRGGACKVCATASGGMSIAFSGTAPKDGKTSLEAYVRRVPGTSSPGSATGEVVSGNSNASTNSSIDDREWKRLGNTRLTLANGASVTVRVGAPSAVSGDCIIVDDVSLVIP